MKILKKIGIGLGIFIVLLLVIGFILPREVNVKRSITVNAPVDQVYAQVNDLRNWENWSPWKKMDPMMQLSYSNPPTGKGAFYNWKSDNPNVGNGKLTLAETIPNRKIVTALEFQDWGESRGEWNFESKGNKTEVSWAMSNDMGGNPIARYMGLFMKGALKKQFDEGLIGIKKEVESK